MFFPKQSFCYSWLFQGRKVPLEAPNFDRGTWYSRTGTPMESLGLRIPKSPSWIVGSSDEADGGSSEGWRGAELRGTWKYQGSYQGAVYFFPQNSPVGGCLLEDMCFFLSDEPFYIKTCLFGPMSSHDLQLTLGNRSLANCDWSSCKESWQTIITIEFYRILKIQDMYYRQ